MASKRRAEQIRRLIDEYGGQRINAGRVLQAPPRPGHDAGLLATLSTGKPRLVEVNVAANEIPPGFTLILVNGRRNRAFLAFRRGRAFASDPVGRNGVIFGLGPGDQDLHRARRCRYAQICAVHGYVVPP